MPAYNPNSDAYRVQGGIGTRQIGLFQASLYSGYQGSETEGSGTAGGVIYGAKLSYYPTLMWSIVAALDSTTNVTSQPCSSATPSTQALSLPTDTPVQIALSNCSHITTPSLQTTYQLSPQWTLLGDFNYSRIVDIDSPGVTNAWLASLTVSYEIRRNMTLSAQYQYTDIASNVAGESAKRNLIMVSAVYKILKLTLRGQRIAPPSAGAINSNTGNWCSLRAPYSRRCEPTPRTANGGHTPQFEQPSMNRQLQPAAHSLPVAGSRSRHRPSKWAACQ